MLAVPQGLIVLIEMTGEDGYRAFDALERAGFLVRQADMAAGPVGLANFAALLSDQNYLHSFQVTALFSVLVAGSGIGGLGIPSASAMQTTRERVR